MSTIVDTLMSELAAEGRELKAAVIKSENDAAWNRVVLGRFLLEARRKLPKRGTPTHGWGALLEAIEMDQATADRYTKLAEASVDLTERDKAKVPTYADIGLDKREGPQVPDVPPPRDDDAPAEVLNNPPPANLHGRNAPDGDEYCTPKWIAEALGLWDLDPCSNERSHVQSIKCFRLDRGQDGILLADKVDAKTRTFINPPYSDVTPWIEAYANVRFCFLLKFDPSTKWFAELIENTELVLIPDGTRLPEGTRIAFEPPPGKESGPVAFPHAFFFAKKKDAPKALLDVCYRWDVE